MLGWAPTEFKVCWSASSHVNTIPDAEEKGLNLARGSIDSRPRWMILLLWTPDEDACHNGHRAGEERLGKEENEWYLIFPFWGALPVT